ncbi:hypothetical protein BV25DRAFT_1830790 [Artomyces pyxidatus]|uniref:Uncharacterized protein n=1 Tax=Artomyces pyxidatus TaxID=48021 RepID=A0ACB8SNC9_9AGAM|nr:hypothetical protein BV25DRAFT_1830790 [Artomyces pyxidatus]
MLLLLFLVYTGFMRTGSGWPLAADNQTMSTGTQMNSTIAACSAIPADISSWRTIDNIIWSSLTTIFACVWTAIHRNIPGPSQGRKARMWEMVKIVVVTLLVPEWVVSWAVRQRTIAGHVCRVLNSEEVRSATNEAWKRNGGTARKNDDSDIAIESVTAADGSVATREANMHTLPEGMDQEGSINEVEGDDEGNSGFIEGEDTIPLGPLTLTSHLHPGDDSPGSVNNELERVLLGSSLIVEQGAGRLDPSRNWTIQHGFFIIMGGFHLYENGEPRHPLPYEDVVELVKIGQLVPPTEDEIDGLGQADTLSKGIVILQTAWFVFQCGARLHSGLPMAQLEVMTLAYAVLTGVMYTFWFHKPQNVNCPVRVVARPPPSERLPAPLTQERIAFGRFITGDQDGLIDLRRQSHVPTFYAGVIIQGPDLFGGTRNASGNYVALIVAVAFGATHCIAWKYNFPSSAEIRLWRMASFVIIATPVAGFIAMVLFMLTTTPENRGGRSVSKTIMGWVVGLSFPLYLVARLILLGLAFATLKDLSCEVYEALDWTLRWPHIT